MWRQTQRCAWFTCLGSVDGAPGPLISAALGALILAQAVLCDSWQITARLRASDSPAIEGMWAFDHLIPETSGFITCLSVSPQPPGSRPSVGKYFEEVGLEVWLASLFPLALLPPVG